MSGNSADSYSEGDSEGEQVKEKLDTPDPSLAPVQNPTPTLLYVRKGKNNGRVGRPKKLKNTQPSTTSSSSPPVKCRRGSGEPKSDSGWSFVAHFIKRHPDCVSQSRLSKGNIMIRIITGAENSGRNPTFSKAMVIMSTAIMNKYLVVWNTCNISYLN